MQSIIERFAWQVAAEFAIGARAGRRFRRDQISLVRRDWAELDDSPQNAGSGLGALRVLRADIGAQPIPGVGAVLAVGSLVAVRRSASTPRPRRLVAHATAPSSMPDASIAKPEPTPRGGWRGEALLAVHAVERVVETSAVLHRARTAAACTGTRRRPKPAGSQPLRRAFAGPAPRQRPRHSDRCIRW